jgi:monofunctional biosynthetic peptidoglycan transglycosylase
MERKLRAEHWYRKEAAGLTPASCGIFILPNPRKYAATSSSSHINRRKAKIVRVMRTVGKLIIRSRFTF